MSKLSPAPKPKHRAQKKRFAARRDPAYIEWLRTRGCALVARRAAKWGYHICYGSMQVCHVKSRGAGGNDRGNCVSMCWNAHEEQHRIGIRSFQTRWGIDLKAEAERLYQQYLAELDAP